MISTDLVTVSPYCLSFAIEWRDFLAKSNNGTLFHDLDFLQYHPLHRFETNHLMFRMDGCLLALLPAAVVTEADGQRWLKSPYGGSVGGFVLPVGQSVATTLALVNSLKTYVTEAKLSGIEMRIGPNVYDSHPNDELSFALMAAGFVLVRRWLSHLIPLPRDPGAVLHLLKSRRRSYVRSALNQGLIVTSTGPEYLPQFYRMLEENRAKHNARPTHEVEDLERIYQLKADRVKLFLCKKEQQIIAGTLVFELNDRVAYSFYPCHDEAFEKYRPASVVTVYVAQHYASRGFIYLDLGPSTFDDLSLNEGLAHFKEEMGGIGFNRDTWRFTVGV